MDWAELRKQFTNDYQDSPISLKHWCKKKGVSYTNARKQISVKQVKSSLKLDEKSKRQNVNVAQPSKANRTSFSGGNQAARVHGGYSSILDSDCVELAATVHGLDDELLACRARLVSVIKARTEAEKHSRVCGGLEERIRLAELILKLTDAEDRAVARIESLTATLDKIERNRISNLKDTTQTELVQQTIDLRANSDNQAEKVVYNIDW